MDSETAKQIIEKLTQSTNVLIVVPNGSSADLVGTGLALHTFLRRLDKQVTLIATTEISTKLNFLPEHDQVGTDLDVAKSFIIDLSTKRTELSELTYQKDTDKLSIFLRPKSGQFTSEDVSFRDSGYPISLVVTLGVTSLDQLNGFYERNTDLFFETTVINIDNKPSNESFGQINYVVLTATSCAEIVMDLLIEYEQSLFDEQIATLLLTGIITETNSFQHTKTTPQVFLKASRLMGFGAKQQEIISQLYKSKSLSLLKLWGRVLARLKTDQKMLLAYSMATLSDIEKSQASEEDLTLIIKEMSSQLGFAKIFFFIAESAENHCVVFASTTLPLSLASLFQSFLPKGLGPQTVRFETDLLLLESEKIVLAILESQSSIINQ